jgi:hypothetical protein
MVDTPRGPLPLGELRVEEGTEKVPCGVCVTTRYFWGEEQVRQDVRIEVDPTIMSSFTGL